MKMQVKYGNRYLGIAVWCLVIILYLVRILLLLDKKDYCIVAQISYFSICSETYPRVAKLWPEGCIWHANTF